MANETLFDEPDPPYREVHPNLYLGSAGWSYDDWEGPFYPVGTASTDRLSHYAKHFRTVEIDSTFYGTPRLATVQGWRMRTPDNFVFSAKFPRAITHEARLRNCADDTYYFVETMQELGPKMGPLLLQLPPSFHADRFGDLARFLEGLPDGLMYAVEVRHRSWLTDEFAELLKRWSVALCMPSASAHLQRFWRVTARFVYIRWLGRQNVLERFDREQIPRDEDFDWWVPRVRHFLDYGGTVFGYVNNNYTGHSPDTVRQLSLRIDEAVSGADEEE